MSCISNALKGLTNDCELSMGGIKRVWIADYKAGAASMSGTTGEIGAISADCTFYEFYIRKNTSSFTSTLNRDDAAGYNYVSTELALVFSKMETKKRIEMSALCSGDFMCIVEDANGVKWFLGFDEACTASAGTGETGTSKQDGNKYTLTISNDSQDWLYALNADATFTVYTAGQ